MDIILLDLSILVLPCGQLQEVSFSEELLFTLLYFDDELPHRVIRVNHLVNLSEAAFVKFIQDSESILKHDTVHVVGLHHENASVWSRFFVVASRNLLKGPLYI